MLARIIAGIAMGGVAFFLIGPLTLLSFRDGSSAVFASYVLLTMMLVGIAIVVLWSASAQAAWSRLCLTDGAASIAFGVLGLAVRGETGWPSGWSYEHEVARAIGPLSFLDLLRGHGTELGVAAVLLGIVLLVLGYRISPPSSRGRRRPH